jgi:malate dehydrogenase (oxaloacetate-decarboxylating)(NADP+)
MRQISGCSAQVAQSRFALLDKYGLITRDRQNMPDEQKPYAVSASPEVRDGMSLVETIRQFKPNILLGLSGVGGIFSEEAIREMSKYCPRPIIFPLSNPTTHAECSAEQAFKWTNGRAIFASGSPFDPVQMDGQTYWPNQGNNMFIFPGLGLGAVICKAKAISDSMFHAAAMRLADSVTTDELQRGIIFPRVRNIREVSKNIAVAVIEQAISEGNAKPDCIPEGKTVEQVVKEYMWEPSYPSIVYQPPGSQ